MFELSPSAMNLSGEAISGGVVDEVDEVGVRIVEFSNPTIILTNCAAPIRLVMESVQFIDCPTETVEFEAGT